MPWFHLHVVDGHKFMDTKGHPFANADAACREALHYLRSLKKLGKHVRAIRVTDDVDNEVAVVSEPSSSLFTAKPRD